MLHPETLPLVQAFAQAGVTVWLIGGQAVEVLCGGNIRPHDDIDFLVREGDGARAVAVLEALGFTQVHGSLDSGDVFYRRAEVLVDLVPIQDDLDPPRTVGELAPLVWPAGFLTPHAAEWEGVRVPTLTPSGHRAMKAVVAAFYGMELRDRDRVDLAALATLGA